MYVYAAEQIRSGNRDLSLYQGTYIQTADIPDSHWTAVAYVSRSEVLKELLDLTRYITIAAVLTIIGLILLVVILVRRIIGRPVRELSQVATRIAEGELEQTIRYQSRDELGVLAHNFNEVTIRLSMRFPKSSVRLPPATWHFPWRTIIPASLRRSRSPWKKSPIP